MLRFKIILILLLVLGVTVPAMAGGWAVITIDSLPAEVKAGENVHLEFMVRQHGETPVHTVDFLDDAPVEPFLLARNEQTGETIRVTAQRAEEVGRFTIDFVLPSEGSWQWEITPFPLEGTVEMEPLLVIGANVADLEAVASSAEANAPQLSPSAAGTSSVTARSVLQWTAMALLLASAVIGFLTLRQRHVPARALSSRPE